MHADAARDDLWGRLSDFVAQNTGLHFPDERRPDLQRGFAAAAAEFGFPDCASCADWLLSAPLSKPQVHALASHLTIGETYFFRERQSFDALARHVLPALFRRRRDRGRRLRLWSAACSTGEEPYSLAILVQQLLPDWRDWDLTILATDINERFLCKARAGVYGEWSFRQAPSGLKERYFTRMADGRFEIRPEVRDCVTFTSANLAQQPFPAPTIGAGSMDVILCRNVLIYFTPSQARKLAENLHRALADGGWLAVSPSECSQALFPQFGAVNFPGSILYRKCNAEERAVPRPEPEPSRMMDAGDAASPFAGNPIAGGSTPAAPATPLAPEPLPLAPEPLPLAPEPLPLASEPFQPLQPGPGPGPGPRPGSGLGPGPREYSLLARASAGRGRHADALGFSERWIEADKIDPAARYVQAMILQEMGESEAAKDSLHRAIYLQPDFVLAHFALGNAARSEARAGEATRHFSNALHALGNCPPDLVLPESDGMTAGRLAEIITTLLARAARE